MLVGISMVRNEADIIRACIDHHLQNEGFDKILFFDDGSTDGTYEIIEGLNDGKISVDRRQGEFRQAEGLTELARRAFAAGASWIVPFDADELWHSPGGLSHALNQYVRHDAIKVNVTNYVQNRSVLELGTPALRRVKYRAERFGDLSDTRELVETERCSYVESAYPPKFIHRASPELRIAPGNHDTQGKNVAEAERIHCLHLPLRARNILKAKIEQSHRLDEANYPAAHGWHLRRFAEVEKQGRLDVEWSANSEKRGRLATVRGPVQLTYDPIIPQLIGRFIAPPGRIERSAEALLAAIAKLRRSPAPSP